MKPFDLEAAKRGEPIITRDGRPAKFIAHVPEADEGDRVIVLDDKSKYRFCSEDGSYSGAFGIDSGFELFMSPRKRTVWVNLYPGTSDACWHDSKEEADGHAGDDRIGNRAYPIEIEE